MPLRVQRLKVMNSDMDGYRMASTDTECTKVVMNGPFMFILGHRFANADRRCLTKAAHYHSENHCVVLCAVQFAQIRIQSQFFFSLTF